jgi:WD40 repeat protein
VQSVTFSPDGHTALTCGDDYMARLWDVKLMRVRGLPFRHPDKVQVVAFSPGGDLVASGGKANQVRLWDVTTGSLASLPSLHDGEVHALAFSPDGKYLYSGSWDGTIRRWDVPQPRREKVARLRLWVEVHTGLRLDATGAVVSLNLDEWRRRVRELAVAEGRRSN